MPFCEAMSRLTSCISRRSFPYSKNGTLFFDNSASGLDAAVLRLFRVQAACTSKLFAFVFSAMLDRYTRQEIHVFLYVFQEADRFHATSEERIIIHCSATSGARVGVRRTRESGTLPHGLGISYFLRASCSVSIRLLESMGGENKCLGNWAMTALAQKLLVCNSSLVGRESVSGGKDMFKTNACLHQKENTLRLCFSYLLRRSLPSLPLKLNCCLRHKRCLTSESRYSPAFLSSHCTRYCW